MTHLSHTAAPALLGICHQALRRQADLGRIPHTVSPDGRYSYNAAQLHAIKEAAKAFLTRNEATAFIGISPLQLGRLIARGFILEQRHPIIGNGLRKADVTQVRGAYLIQGEPQ